MLYAKAVVAAKSLQAHMESDQWELARLTYQVLAVDRSGTEQQWARDLSVSVVHVRNLRKTWERFGENHGFRSFNECYTLARASEERAKRLVEEAARTGRSVGTVDRQARLRRRMDVARSVLRSKRWRRELIRDPKLAETLERELAERRPASDDEVSGEGSDERPRDARQLRMELVEDVAGLREQLDEVLEDAEDVKFDKALRRSLASEMAEIEERLAKLRALVQPDRPAKRERAEDVADPHTSPPAEEVAAETPDVTPPPAGSNGSRKKRAIDDGRRPDRRPPGDKLRERASPATVP